MKTVFYKNPIKPATVAMLRSEDPEADLKKFSIVNEDEKYLLIENFDPVNNNDDAAIVTFMNCMVFDDQENPTALVADPDLLKIQYIEILRTRRASAFETLDILHMSAISKSKLDVAYEIETDKQKLRDITISVNYDKIATLYDLVELVPAELLVDYSEKYQGRL